MSEIAALSKYACPACGAEAQWNPAKQALVCRYCGTVSPAELSSDGTVIREHDLASALRSLPQSRKGWDAGRVAVQCQSCKAISLFDPTHVARNCEFCGSPKVVPQDAVRSPIVPESVLPFQLSESQVREQVRQWYGGRWFAPDRLKRGALTDTVHGLYIPYWTFDAKVSAHWTAEAGHYYYQTVRRGGKTVRERRIRWEPASGSLDHVFDDELVPATRGVKQNLLKKVEPFPTDALVPYDHGYVSGWVVEQYQIDLVSAADAARRSMDAQLRAMCAARVPGDTHRNLSVKADYSGQTFKHVLVPLWLVAYNYHATAYQLIVNGFNGRIAGQYPFSWVKIALAVIAGILLLIVLGYLTD
jgi:hypothetical protein